MSAKSQVLLEHYLKNLKLPSILREHRKMASVCQAEGADYATYLLRLIEQEIHDREQRAAERRLKSAKFPVVKTLDSFRFDAQPSINQAMIREIDYQHIIQTKSYDSIFTYRSFGIRIWANDHNWRTLIPNNLIRC